MIPLSSCLLRQPDALGPARGRCASQASYTTSGDTTARERETNEAYRFALSIYGWTDGSD
jgi:hypothetical protein